MTRPTEADYESWIEECVAHLQDSKSYSTANEHANEFLLLYGVIARTI